MPELALGTANFGMHYGFANEFGQISSDSVAEILSVAKQAGIRCLDTANAYGESQRVLGEIGVEDWRVVSKISSIEPDCKNVAGFVIEQVKKILEDLQVKSIDTILVHNAQDLIGQNGDQIFSVLHELKHDNVVAKIGVSIYEPGDIDTIVRRYPIEVVQAPLNVLDNRLASFGYLEQLNGNGIEVHARSIFLQGLLISRRLQEQPNFRQWQETFRHWNEFSDSSGRSNLANCVGHVRSFEQISQIVVGVDSPIQLGEVIGAFSGLAERVPVLDIKFDEKLINPSAWSQL